MKYDAYSYLWPPRPEQKIPQGMMAMYERKGYWAQVKKNGTCTLIFVEPRTAHGNRRVIFRTRHGDELHKGWTPLQAHEDFFDALPGDDRWQVYVAELLHSKTPHIKNHLYIFDQIVLDGEQLVGSTFLQRQTALHAQFKGGPSCGLGAYRVAPYISIATTFDGGFNGLWAGLAAEDEGLVFKNPEGTLAACITPTANAGWQVKCRRPTKNYSF